ncbi:MAG: carbohydrate kinase family protein [Ancrocorticia sp.]|uniref:carbohydrate kinase family protein n=1 Tax=Ancrocorticia sp. TaxID=2593684 RepID=UPI003F8F2B50
MSSLVIGEALVDVITAADGTVVRHPGGSMLNVAIGLRRLGRTVRLVTDFGQDSDGAMLEEYAASNGLELWLREDAFRTSPTSTASVTVAADGEVSYDFDFTWDIQDTPQSAACKLDLEILDPTTVAFGSFSTRVAPGAEKVLDWIRHVRGDATVFYDPNVRQVLLDDIEESRRMVKESVVLSDIVKASEEDLRVLYGEGVNCEKVAEEWLTLGPAIVVITRGFAGADAYSCDGSVLHQPAPPVDVVDTVGAGASFFAALIDGLTRISLDGAEYREDLRRISPANLRTLVAYAATSAAITISRPGASLPTRGELVDQHELYQTAGMTGVPLS